jgi:outer membrane lipoprotein-sorting protein
MNRLKTSIRSLAAASVLVALCPASAQNPAPAPSPATVPSQLNEAVGALRAISTLKADFVQTDRAGQRVNGVLTLKRPGMIRFQYAPGNPLLIVSDGKALTLIDYDVRQVQRWPIKNSPLGVLLDPNRDISRYGRLQPVADPNVISIEVRDRSHPEFGVITLVFVRKATAPGGLELTTWVALDSQNKRTTIRLANQQYGVAVSEDAFKWNDPRRPARR